MITTTTTTRITHKSSSKRHGQTKRSTATILCLFLMVLYVFSTVTMMQNYWKLSSSASTTTRSSDSNDAGRKLSTKSSKAAQPQTNVTSTASKVTSHKTDTKSKTKNKNNDKLSTHTIPWKQLATLQKATNLTYVEDLVEALEESEKVYWPGSWDGAGIVVEEYKLVLFTQGKVCVFCIRQCSFRSALKIVCETHTLSSPTHTPTGRMHRFQTAGKAHDASRRLEKTQRTEYSTQSTIQWTHLLV